MGPRDAQERGNARRSVSYCVNLDYRLACVMAFWTIVEVGFDTILVGFIVVFFIHSALVGFGTGFDWF